MTNSARLIRGGLSRAEIDVLNAEAWTVRRTDPERAAELSRLTVRRAEATAYRRGIGQARVVQGFLANRGELLDVALEACLAALPDLEPDGPTSWLAWAHTIIGSVSSEVGEDERARHHYAVAFETATLAHDTEAAAGARLNMALLHPEPDEQLPLLREAVESFDRIEVPAGKGFARYNLAECLLDLGHVDEAARTARQAIDDADMPGLEGVRLAASVVIGRCLAAQGHVEEAVAMVRGHLDRDLDADPGIVSAAARALSELQLQAGDPEGALTTLAVVQAAMAPDNPHAVALARQISELHARLGDFDAAYAALRRHHEQRESIAAESSRRRVAILEVLYRTRETEAQVGMQRALADELDGRVARLTQLTEAAQEVSLTDPVTGLANRRRLDRELTALAASPRHRPVCLALVDIDELSVVNAELGHLVGDTALRQIARLLDENAPPGVLLARLEAEDFALLIDDCELERGLAECERLRAVVEGHALSAELHGRGFTVSIGVTSAQPPFDADRVMRLADDALYEAKDSGRNRVLGRTADGIRVAPEPPVGRAPSTDRDGRSAD